MHANVFMSRVKVTAKGRGWGVGQRETGRKMNQKLKILSAYQTTMVWLA